MIIKDMYCRDFLVYGTSSGDLVFADAASLKETNRFNVGSPITTLLVTKNKRFILVGIDSGELIIVTDPTALLNMLKKQWEISSSVQL